MANGSTSTGERAASVSLHQPLPPSRFALAAWGLVAVGVVLRLVRYAANRNLWVDEILLVRSALDHPIGDLLRPLDYDQGAPVAFLALVHAAADLLGRHEYVLRLVPLLAGCASLFLFRQVALRVLVPRAVLLALALFAVVEPLVYYAAELKQYSSDVTVALAVLLAALRAADGGLRVAPLITLALVGAITVWLSHPAVFVLAGVGVALLADALRAGDRRGAVLLAGVGAAWAVSFAVDYELLLRPLVGSDYLQHYWQDAFMPARPLAAARWQVGALLGSLRYPVGIPLPAVAALAATLGAVDLARRQPRVVAFLLLPVALGMVSSAFHQFPFGGRVILFITPAFVLLIAAGIESLLAVPLARVRLTGALLALLVIGPPVVAGARAALDPPGWE